SAFSRAAPTCCQGDEEAIVERRKGIAGVAHQNQGADHRLTSEQRKDRRIGMACCRRAGAVCPLAGHLGSPGLQRTCQSDRGRAFWCRSSPALTYAGSAHEAGPLSVEQVQRAAAYRRQGERPREQYVQYILLSPDVLQTT